MAKPLVTLFGVDTCSEILIFCSTHCRLLLPHGKTSEEQDLPHCQESSNCSHTPKLWPCSGNCKLLRVEVRTRFISTYPKVPILRSSSTKPPVCLSLTCYLCRRFYQDALSTMNSSTHQRSSCGRWVVRADEHPFLTSGQVMVDYVVCAGY